jgi:hypothetical protein
MNMRARTYRPLVFCVVAAAAAGCQPPVGPRPVEEPLVAAPPGGQLAAGVFAREALGALGPAFAHGAPGALDATGATTVTTDATMYPDTQSIVVTYTNMSGASHDWVSLAPLPSADTVYARWVYLGGQVNGSARFAALPAGTYEARAYFNDQYVVQARSMPITVTSTGTVSASIQAGSSTYLTTDPMAVTWSNLAGYPTDWIAVSLTTDDDAHHAVFFYTGGARAGTHSFTNLAAGTYEARAYLDNTTTRQATSMPFVVSAPPAPSVTLTTDASSYMAGDAVIVHYSGMPGSSHDWISIAAAGSPDTAYVAWVYTGGQVTSQHGFHCVPPGSYVARAYFNDGIVKQAESLPFTVAAATMPVVDQEQLASTAAVLSQVGTNAGHSVTVGRCGTLTGVELSLMHCHGTASEITLTVMRGGVALGTVGIPPATLPPCTLMPPSLAAGSTGPGFFDLSALGITVAPGQVITLLTTAPPPPAGACSGGHCADGTTCTTDSNCNEVYYLGGDNSDFYPGGTIVYNGSSGGTFDLAFKTFVQ